MTGLARASTSCPSGWLRKGKRAPTLTQHNCRSSLTLRARRYDNGDFKTTLRSLKLRDNSLTDAVFAQLADSNLTNVKFLDVGYNQLDSLGSSRWWTSADHLDLSGNSAIGVVDLVDFKINVDAAGRDPASLAINASYCGIEDISRQTITLLSKLDLDLGGNPIKEANWAYTAGFGLDAVPRWAPTLSQLEKLDLSFSRVSQLSAGTLPRSVREIDFGNVQREDGSGGSLQVGHRAFTGAGVQAKRAPNQPNLKCAAERSCGRAHAPTRVVAGGMRGHVRRPPRRQ